jgi:protocatechuate 3,4-dioxygenase beta subunit
MDHHRDEQQDEQMAQEVERSKNEGLLSRRTVISALGVGATGLALVGAGEVALHPQNAVAAAPAVACVLAAELTEGPYYVALENIRTNITEGKPGVPLTLKVTVVNTTACAVIQGAAVDIWHCDALGSYSDEAALGTSGQIFLRGTQLTDASGVATFTTIYPGWYTGRAIHIHTKVHIGGSVVGSTYQGGHVSHTGQFFFDESMTAQVKLLSPYTSNRNAYVSLTQDSIYPKNNTAGALVTLSGSTSAGLVATVVVGINPNATP